MTSQVKSSQVKSSQIKSNQIKSNQIKSNQIKSNQILSAADIVAMLDHADEKRHCWILLGINCGFDSSDLSGVRREHVQGSFIDLPRPKTGVPRRCSLWPETIAAIAATANETEPIFSSNNKGTPVVVVHSEKKRTDNVIYRWRKCRTTAGIKIGGFSLLRHTHRTITDECEDQPAENYSMGHSQRDMADNYRHRISDERLIVIAHRVRYWLFQKTS